MTQSATIKLTQPIQRGETPISEVTLRKPMGGDLRGLNVQSLMQSDYNAIRTIVPRIAVPQLLETDLDAMEAENITALADALLGFFMTSAQKAAIMGAFGPTSAEQSTS